MPNEPAPAPLSLASILRPLTRQASAELAEALSNLRLEEAAQRRYDELAEKNTEGALTAAERQELADFVSYNRLVGTLKAEALLARGHPAAA
jgi:hypothetical protein